MAKRKKQLIVSFVGGQDLKHFGLWVGPAWKSDPSDSSPILRLLRHLATESAADVDSAILLFDDEPGTGARTEFAACLDSALRDESITRYPEAQVRNITGHSGPTDLGGLFKAVWASLDLPKADRPDDIVFHVSSGTPAMHATLMVAAMCLYERSRMFETSKRSDQGVTAIRPPFKLALKQTVRSHARGALKLSERARNTLNKGLVISDPVVEAEFAALHKAASRPTAPQVIIRGPAGSGKWQAALQFARWRGKSHPAIEWNDPQAMTANDARVDCKSTVVIRHLDRWTADELRALQIWTRANPMAAVAATWRDDRRPRVPLSRVTDDGLMTAAHFSLPAFFTREDTIAVAMAMASSPGLHPTHVHERLQYDLLHRSAPRTLHELNTLLAHADSRSPGPHITQDAFGDGIEMRRAQRALDTLHEAFEAILGLAFTPDRGLEAVLDEVKYATTLLAADHGRTQDDVARILGCKASTVGAWKRAALAREPSPNVDDGDLSPGNAS